MLKAILNVLYSHNRKNASISYTIIKFISILFMARKISVVKLKDIIMEKDVNIGDHMD